MSSTDFANLLRKSANLLFDDAEYFPDFDFDVTTNCLEINHTATEYNVINPNSGMRLEIISATKNEDSVVKYRRKRERRHKTKYHNVLTARRAPNMSRRVQGPALCAFPTFDKCDSLVFLPTTVVKCFNTEDFDGLAKAFKLHVHKNCAVHFREMQFSVVEFLQAMALLSQLHPDKVSCCHDTKVIDNAIHAKVLCKFTENSMVARSVADSGRAVFPGLFPRIDRATRWKHHLSHSQLSSEEQEQAVQLAATEADMLVYGTLSYTFTFDPNTRKVVRLEYDMCHTAIRPAITTAGDAPNI